MPILHTYIIHTLWYTLKNFKSDFTWWSTGNKGEGKRSNRDVCFDENDKWLFKIDKYDNPKMILVYFDLIVQKYSIFS